MAGIVTIPKTRYLRRRKLRGTIRGAGVPRLKRLEAFLAERATTLAGTGASQTITAVDTGNERITITGHGRVAGNGPFIVASTGTLPGGLVDGDIYWVNDFSVNELTLHRQREDAFNAVNAVNLTSVGSGTITLEPADDSNAGMEAILRLPGRGLGVSAPRLKAETDIDNLV